MGKNAVSIADIPAAKREWWDALRPDDLRYPRAKALAAARTVGRLAWLPVTVYLGNAATNLVTTLSAQGVAAVATLDGFAGALQLRGFVQVAQRNPWAAAAILALLAVVGGLIYLAQRDTRREAAVLRMREMLRLIDERAARTMSAETLRDELRALQAVLAADTSALKLAASQEAKGAGQAVPQLAGQLARLGEISAMLSRDLGTQAMWDELMSQQMAAWQRRERLLAAGMSAATILIGGLLPLLFNPGAIGL